MVSQLLVCGSQEFGHIVKNLVLNCGYEFVGFIDKYASGEDILGAYDHVIRMFPLELFGTVMLPI